MSLGLKFNKTLMLGSKSPRRAFLMKEAGFAFVVKTLDVDESYPESLHFSEVAEYIAKKKAEAYSKLLVEDIGIVADTIVVHNDKILEKPKNYDDARSMLLKLSGNVHSVYTGCSLFSQTEIKSFTGISKVHFDTLEDWEIEYYLKKFNPYDKAGSYGIQDWIGYVKVKHIEGSYTNIMGLPMEKVYKELLEF